LKKIISLLLLFLVLFSANVDVNAKQVTKIEAQAISKRVFEEVENGAINESASFANIVIFIKFADETSYEAPYDYTYYESLFNSLTVASLKSYYLEVSYNQLTIESYIVNDGTTMIYFQDINDRSYYEVYDETTNPNGYDGSAGNTQGDREHALLKRAIDYVETNDLVSDTIDLDVNSDGDVDSITFMVSGEDNGWNKLLWPHKWNLASYYNYNTGEYYADAPMINGLYAYAYTFELLGNTAAYERKVDVGVLCHETFHLISAPDLYHYDRYFNIEPVGDWGLMEGTTEISSHMLGYMKQMYGNWITSVDEITESGTYTLAPMADAADNLYKIDLGHSNEFIYLEYRLQEGLYETYLPNTGLLVYRVDFDYFDEGNVSGYYSTTGLPRDELFIFRPGISIDTLPIIFPEIDTEGIDEDGDIDNAAISNNNTFNEMGNDTDVAMFYSDGSLIDIKIYNVLEHDGVITFDIYLPPRIELVSELDIPDGTQLYLFDGDGFEYRLNITNIPDGALVYYTQDGTTPSSSSTLYLGGIINFNSTSNVIKAALYVDGELISSLEKTFNFTDEIESNHNPYGDYENITWYLDLADDLSDYDLHFFSGSELENGYDFVYITNSVETLDYTGTALANLDLSFDEDIIINFVSDQTQDGFYGFQVEVDLVLDLLLTVTGDRTIILEVFDTYTELGASLSGESAAQFTLEIVGTVDTTTLGVYVITYNVLDSNLDIVTTSNRTITVLDTTDPEIVLLGEQSITINVYDNYTDLGVEYSDNLDTVLDYNLSNNVDPNVVGIYDVVYTVTDLSGNIATIIRTVNVVDTEAPTVTLVPFVDTIYVDDMYVLPSVIVTDNYYDSFDIDVTSNVDTSTVDTYIVEYTVTDGSGNSVTIYRYVNVIEKTTNSGLIFEIEKAVTTIKIGEEFTAPTCTISGELAGSAGTCEIDLSKIDTSTAGTYRILYYTEIDGEIYTKESYVFVYDSSDLIIWYYDKSRRGYLWENYCY